MSDLLFNSTKNLTGYDIWLDWLGFAQSSPATPLLPFVPKHGESLVTTPELEPFRGAGHHD